MSHAVSLVQTAELIGLIMEELSSQYLTKDLARCAQINHLWHKEASRVLWRILDPYIIINPASRDHVPRIWRGRGMLSYVQPERQQRYANLVREITFRQDLLFSTLQSDELNRIATLEFPRLHRVEVVELLQPRKSEDGNLVLSAIRATMTTAPLVAFAIYNTGLRHDRRVDYFLERLPWQSCHLLQTFIFKGTTKCRYLVDVLKDLPFLRHLELCNIFVEEDHDFERLLSSVWTRSQLETLTLDFQAYKRRDHGLLDTSDSRLELEDGLASVTLPEPTPSLSALRSLSLSFRPQLMQKILNAVADLNIEDAELRPRLLLEEGTGTVTENFFPEKQIASLRRLHVKYPAGEDLGLVGPRRKTPHSWVLALHEQFPGLESIRWTDLENRPLLLEFNEEDRGLLRDIAPINA